MRPELSPAPLSPLVIGGKGCSRQAIRNRPGRPPDRTERLSR